MIPAPQALIVPVMTPLAQLLAAAPGWLADALPFAFVAGLVYVLMQASWFRATVVEMGSTLELAAATAMRVVKETNADEFAASPR